MDRFFKSNVTNSDKQQLFTPSERSVKCEWLNAVSAKTEPNRIFQHACSSA